MIGIEPRTVARRGLPCPSTPVGELGVVRGRATVRRTVLAVQAERRLPARAAGELGAEAR